MKISIEAKDLLQNIQHKIVNEKEFSILSIGPSPIELPKCIFVDQAQYIDTIPDGTAMIITSPELEMFFSNTTFGLLIIDNPRFSFFMLHNYLANTEKYIGELEDSTIGQECEVGKFASISPVGVTIGDNVTIEDFVVVNPNTVIGNNSIIRSGTVIGAQGFENKKNNSTTISVKHVGGVRIGENVDISHNSTIQRGIFPWQNTTIGSGTRIDNLVLIGHASQIGDRVFIVGNSMLCGHVEIGDDTWVGASVTISNRIKIGKNARLNIGSVVTKDVADGESVTGNFAIPHERFICNIKELSKD